jgi:hypothetical protein
MQRGQNTVEPILPKEQATAHADTRDFLNPAQRGAIEEVLTTRDRVHGLQGLAGTGKTTTLEAIREGAERNGYATVASIDAAANRITVGTEDGKQITYAPERLHGITTYREITRDFAEGDRIQFTAANRELGVSNRDLGAIERIDGTRIDVKMDGDKERIVSFDAAQMRHFDHGYAVTSHSSHLPRDTGQSLQSERWAYSPHTTFRGIDPHCADPSPIPLAANPRLGPRYIHCLVVAEGILCTQGSNPCPSNSTLHYNRQ